MTMTISVFFYKVVRQHLGTGTRFKVHSTWYSYEVQGTATRYRYKVRSALVVQKQSQSYYVTVVVNTSTQLKLT